MTGGVTSAPLLRVDDLQTRFFTADGEIRAVDGVSFSVGAGETLGIVGESGCGKSVTALSILRLLPRRMARVVGGGISFQGNDLLGLPEAAMRDIRGNRIAMIFQEPMTSLNPVLSIGEQIAEALRIHRKLAPAAALAQAGAMLELVRMADPKRQLAAYPHQLSGGMRQRAMIAMALACEPALLIADEPTTALDVTIQAQILTLMMELRARTGAAVLLITHDLGVVAETCQRVIVLYAGRVVEQAGVEALFDAPAHPYTRGLLASRPARMAERRRRLTEIPGMVPSLREPIIGCAFAPRCKLATGQCRREAPALTALAPGHDVACWEAR